MQAVCNDIDLATLDLQDASEVVHTMTTTTVDTFDSLNNLLTAMIEGERSLSADAMRRR